MRIAETSKMKSLREIYEKYIKYNENGAYIPEDAPEKAKSAFKEWRELMQKEREEADALWG